MLAEDNSFFYFPTRLYLGAGCLQSLGHCAKSLGSRALIISVQDEIKDVLPVSAIKDNVEEHIKGAIIYDELLSKPSPTELDSLAYFLKKSRVDMILAYGGRESLAAARTAALLVSNHVFSADLLSTPLPLERPPLPLITVPASLFSIGEEISPGFRTYDKDGHSLVYRADPQLFPKFCFVDTNLNQKLKKEDIIKFCMAILAISIESVFLLTANEMSITHALRATKLIKDNLQDTIENEQSQTLLSELCTAGVFAGLAHSHSGFGLTYSLASAVHSTDPQHDFHESLSIFLPYVMEYNLVNEATLYIRIARALGESIKHVSVLEAAIKAIENVRKMSLDLKLPHKLTIFPSGEEAKIEKLAQHIMEMNTVSNNPRPVNLQDIKTLLQTVTR